jgi:hypothetical protein
MKQFIKENIVLALGVSLPLLLVLLFMLASILPAYFVEAPRHDVLFSDGRYSYVTFEVQQQKLHLKIDPAVYQNNKDLPRLYRYISATGQVKEITFKAPDMSAYAQMQETHSANGISANIVINVDPNNPPSQTQVKDTSAAVSHMKKDVNTAPFTIAIPEASSLDLDTSRIAPDGYQFLDSRYGYNGSGFFWGAGAYGSNAPSLSKSGRNIQIPYNVAQGVYAGSATFIGWVMP